MKQSKIPALNKLIFPCKEKQMDTWNNSVSDGEKGHGERNIMEVRPRKHGRW